MLLVGKNSTQKVSFWYFKGKHWFILFFLFQIVLFLVQPSYTLSAAIDHRALVNHVKSALADADVYIKKRKYGNILLQRGNLLALPFLPGGFLWRPPVALYGLVTHCNRDNLFAKLVPATVPMSRSSLHREADADSCSARNAGKSPLLLIFGGFLCVLNTMLAGELLVVGCLLEEAPRRCHPGSRSSPSVRSRRN